MLLLLLVLLLLVTIVALATTDGLVLLVQELLMLRPMLLPMEMLLLLIVILPRFLIKVFFHVRIGYRHVFGLHPRRNAASCVGREVLVRWNRDCSRDMPNVSPPPRGGRWQVL